MPELEMAWLALKALWTRLGSQGRWILAGALLAGLTTVAFKLALAHARQDGANQARTQIIQDSLSVTRRALADTVHRLQDSLVSVSQGRSRAVVQYRVVHDSAQALVRADTVKVADTALVHLAEVTSQALAAADSVIAKDSAYQHLQDLTIQHQGRELGILSQALTVDQKLLAQKPPTRLLPYATAGWSTLGPAVTGGVSYGRLNALMSWTQKGGGYLQASVRVWP